MPIRVPRPAVPGAIAITLLSAVAATAAPGVVVGGVNLRAGPGLDYPAVALLPEGTTTEIFGCLPGYGWCDIAVNGPDGALRGWAAGPRLQLLYDDQPVLVPQYGATLGLPLLGFDVDDYWGRHYRDRPWYGEAGRWRGDDRGFGPGGPGPHDPGPRGIGPDGFGGFRGGPPPGGFRPGNAHPGGPGPVAGGVRPGGFGPGSHPAGPPGPATGGFHPGAPNGPGPGGFHPGQGPGGRSGDDHGH